MTKEAEGRRRPKPYPWPAYFCSWVSSPGAGTASCEVSIHDAAGRWYRLAVFATKHGPGHPADERRQARAVLEHYLGRRPTKAELDDLLTTGVPRLYGCRITLDALNLWAGRGIQGALF